MTESQKLAEAMLDAWERGDVVEAFRLLAQLVELIAEEAKAAVAG